MAKPWVVGIDPGWRFTGLFATNGERLEIGVIETAKPPRQFRRLPDGPRGGKRRERVNSAASLARSDALAGLHLGRELDRFLARLRPLRPPGFALPNCYAGVCMEHSPFSSRSVRDQTTGFAAEVVCWMAIAQWGMDPELYNPSACKRATAGSSRASKDAVLAAVRAFFAPALGPRVDNFRPGVRQHVYDAASTLLASRQAGGIATEALDRWEATA